MTRSKLYVVLATCFAVAGIGYGAYAQTGAGTPPSMIPYHGYLEDAAGPIDGDRNMTFFITTGPNIAFGDAGALWNETRDVTFSNGYFSVALGEVTPIPGSTFNLPDRYLRVRIDGNTLNGAQRLLATPYAITAQVANNFSVVGAVTAGSVASSGNVTAAGTSDIRAGGGVAAGDSATDVPTGDVVATSGIRVGAHPMTDPNNGDLAVLRNVDVDGNIAVATNLSVGGIITWTNPRYFDSALVTCFKTDGGVNAGCTGPLDIGSTSDRVCFLATVEVKSASGSDFGTCDVVATGGRWTIDARTEAGDIDVRCRARCIRF